MTSPSWERDEQSGGDQVEREQRQHDGEHGGALHRGGEQRRDPHPGHRDRDAPAEEGEAEADRAHLERERRVGEQHEEADVVEQRGAASTASAGLPSARNGAESFTGTRSRRVVLAEQHDDGDEADRHEDRGAEERPAPADGAEQAAEQRADRDAEAERRLVQDDRG